MPDAENILIIDIECTCNEDPPLEREKVEIIEIGAVIGQLYSDSFKVLDTLQLYVQPTLTSKLTPFCTSLTGIGQHTVDSAPKLSAALTNFENWISTFQIKNWVSWGKFDEKQFQVETNLKSLVNPLQGFQHLNMKQLYARKRGHRVGIFKAIELSKLEFIGQHHSGLDDARNIAQLLETDERLRGAILSRV